MVVAAGTCSVALAAGAVVARLASATGLVGLCRVPLPTALGAAVAGLALLAAARQRVRLLSVLACIAAACAFTDIGQYVLAIDLSTPSVQESVQRCAGGVAFVSTPIAVVMTCFALLLLPMLPVGAALCAIVVLAIGAAQQLAWSGGLVAWVAPAAVPAPPAASAIVLALGVGGMGAARLREPGERSPEWTSLAAPAILLVGGVLFWQALVRTQVSGVVRLAGRAASAVRTDVVDAVKGLGSVLEILARLPPDPAREWDEEASVLERTWEGLLALEFIDDDVRVRRRVVLGDRAAPDVPLRADDAAVLARSEAAEGPLVTAVHADAAGRPVVRLVLPRRRGGERHGFVSAVVDVRTMIAAATAESLLEWAVRVEADGRPIFERGAPITEEDGMRLAATRDLTLPDGTTWRVVVMPSATLWRVTRSDLPQVVLVGSILVALLLAATVRLARASAVQAATLAREVEQRREAEFELRTLAGELERRVAERTDELSRVNDSLRSENARREQAERRLRRSNEDLRQFAAFVSHELRQPLSTIGIWTELLDSTAGERLGEERRVHLAKIRSAVARMARLIQGELALAQVTQGDAPKEEVDLAAMLEELRGELAPSLAAAGGRLEVGRLSSVEADPEQLRLVFRNLIENALKYRRPDVPPVIQIDERQDGDPAVCELVVRDNGRGIGTTDTDEIFSMFRRSTDADVQGSGVGLAVCRRIVERHGGTIVAEGRPDDGATFRIRLPRTAAEDDAGPGDVADGDRR